jgi:peroxiredoxin
MKQEGGGLDSARGSLGRPLMWVALFGLLTLLAFGIFGLIFFQAKPAKSPAASDLFERLSIEKPEKTIPAPDFTLEDSSGKRLSLKDLKGKVVFLNFWATWCIPCRQEMPLMEKLHREFKNQGLEMVAINYREDKKAVQKFFDELGLTFKSLVDYDGSVSSEYGAWSLPLTYVINRKGEFVGKTIGDRKWYSEDARAFFRELLETK